MLNGALLTIIALTVLISMAAAKDQKKKEECPTLNLGEIEDLVRKSPTCRRSVAVFELCEVGTSGDLRLGAAVTEKCEADFLGKLSAAQRRAYDGEQKRCAHKYQDKDGTMYRSFEAFCGAYVARDYSFRFLKSSGRAK
jgi:hypothetical protein